MTQFTEKPATTEDAQQQQKNGADAAPLRLLIVAPSLAILGGQAVQAERLLTRLRGESSLEVGFLPINPQLPGVFGKLQKIKYVRTIVTSIAYCLSLLRRVREYDVLHTFSASYFSFVLAPTPAILAAKLYGTKVVLNYHSGEAGDHLTRWRRTALPTIRLADETIVPSGYLVDVFAEFGLPACHIFNIVETDRFTFRERRRLRPVFLSNRNLEPLYNVGCILRAFKIIQNRYPEASLTVAGDGSQRAELERLASELNLRHTKFIGQVAPGKMPDLYEQADIYLNGSNIDNMPLSILEAFSSGLPVVTTKAGGIPYIVTHEETGLLVDCEDHKAMAANAIRLIEDERLATKIIGCAREEMSKYSWSTVRTEWLDLYHRLGAALKNEQAKHQRGLPKKSVTESHASVNER